MVTRTLIISDVHLRVDRVERMIKHEAPDQVIFTGDFFDYRGDTLEETRDMALWLKSNLHKPNYVFIWGNHDVSYLGSNPYTKCSGFTYGKYIAISDILNDKDWDRFVWYYWLGDILLTHAGLTHGLINEKAGRTIGGVKAVKNLLAKNEMEASESLRKHKLHWFYQPGRSRGGAYRFGGITWNDSREFVPIPGVKQIFGHTPDSEPVVYDDGSICLDTHSNHYAIFTDGIKIYDYHDIPNKL